MMTRKTFKALASALNSTRPTGHESCVGTSEAYDLWWKTAQAVADECEASNPNFDRGRFLKVCDDWTVKV